uniref:GTP cyclohydrolase 1 feedback regulatory protein n=1 Tax=Eptatretus burgeri TaxID=7764 RepID=A0A8C4R4X6_EPTBU
MVLICFQENSPTVVGDSSSDPALMRILDAEKVKEPEYRVWNHVRVVLDKLEEEGYSVISMTTVEKTIVWCLHKPYLTENLHMKDQLPEIL